MSAKIYIVSVVSKLLVLQGDSQTGCIVRPVPLKLQPYDDI